LYELYEKNPKFEQLGRKIAEKVAMRNTAIAMSLASDKPEKRYSELLKEKPEIFQRVPQKYIANILGIKPESLSRIQKRISSNLKS
jgi:DNA-directed RNA polymerase specialized sigma subunit